MACLALQSMNLHGVKFMYFAARLAPQWMKLHGVKC